MSLKIIKEFDAQIDINGMTTTSFYLHADGDGKTLTVSDNAPSAVASNALRSGDLSHWDRVGLQWYLKKTGHNANVDMPTVKVQVRPIMRTKIGEFMSPHPFGGGGGWVKPWVHNYDSGPTLGESTNFVLEDSGLSSELGLNDEAAGYLVFSEIQQEFSPLMVPELGVALQLGLGENVITSEIFRFVVQFLGR